MNQSLLPTDPARPRHCPPVWKQLAVAAFLLGSLLVGLLFYTVIASNQELQDAIDEAERMDPNWKLSSLESNQAYISREENSALQVLHVCLLLHADETSLRQAAMDLYSQVHRQHPQPSSSSQQMAILRREMERSAQALQEARKLADMPRGRFEITRRSDAVRWSLEHLHQVQQVAELLALDVLISTDDGDYETAMRSSLALMNTGRSLVDEPCAISQSMRIVIQEAASRALERVLARGSSSESALKQVQAAIEEEAREHVPLIAARGERALLHELLNAMEAGRVPPAQLRFFLGEQRKLGLGDRSVEELQIRLTPGRLRTEHAAVLRLLNQLVLALSLPDREQDAAVRSVEVSRERLPPLARHFIDLVLEVIASHRRSQALLRCTAAGLAAERFRQQVGRWPDSLEELVPAFLTVVPRDPLSDGPLQLQRFENGITVSSFGVTRIDEREAVSGTAASTRDARAGFRLFDPLLRGQMKGQSEVKENRIP